jgi:hypothetical protein
MGMEEVAFNPEDFEEEVLEDDKIEKEMPATVVDRD